MLLHPDKLAGAARAVQSRPTRQTPSVEQRAMAAAAGRGTGVGKAREAKPSLIENLAYEVRDAHWANHLDRMARNIQKPSGARKPVPKPAPNIVLQLPGASNA